MSAGKPALWPARPLGNPALFAGVARQERDDAVGLLQGVGAEDEGI